MLYERHRHGNGYFQSWCNSSRACWKIYYCRDPLLMFSACRPIHGHADLYEKEVLRITAAKMGEIFTRRIEKQTLISQSISASGLRQPMQLRIRAARCFGTYLSDFQYIAKGKSPHKGKKGSTPSRTFVRVVEKRLAPTTKNGHRRTQELTNK